MTEHNAEPATPDNSRVTQAAAPATKKEDFCGIQQEVSQRETDHGTPYQIARWTCPNCGKACSNLYLDNEWCHGDSMTISFGPEKDADGTWTRHHKCGACWLNKSEAAGAAAPVGEALPSSEELSAENMELRIILAKVTQALGTGSFASSACSLNFLKCIPEEVRLTVDALRAALGSPAGGVEQPFHGDEAGALRPRAVAGSAASGSLPLWTITAPDGRQWTAESPIRAAAAAQRDTIDPVLAMQRINAMAAEEQALLEAEMTNAYAEGRKDQFEEDKELLSWAYGKLAYRSFSELDDCLNMDRIKLMLTGAPL